MQLRPTTTTVHAPVPPAPSFDPQHYIKLHWNFIAVNFIEKYAYVNYMRTLPIRFQPRERVVSICISLVSLIPDCPIETGRYNEYIT